MSSFLDTVALFNSVDSETGAAQVLVESAAQMGLTHVMAGIWSDAESELSSGEVLAVTYSDEWMQEYASGLMASDPILKHASRTNLPFLWDQCPIETRDEQDFINLAAEIEGMRYGVSTAIFAGPGKVGAVSLSAEVDCDIEANMADIYALAGAFHSTIQAHRHAGARKKIRLTPREREVLLWQSRGKTYWEIGEVLGTSVDTVRRQTQSAYRKLNVHNSTLAITKAITLNLISP